MRIKCATSRPKGVEKPLSISSGVWSVAFPWPGRRFPSIQFDMVKWKVGPWGRWTTVKPVGFFRSSLSTMTAVYLRLQILKVSISSFSRNMYWESRWGCRIGGNALKCETYFVAKEQISRTENLWLYRCEDRGM